MTSTNATLRQAVVDHHGMVFRLAFSVLGNRADAEDVTQATFLKLTKQRHALGRIESLAAWLGRVAINTARQHIRGECNRRHRESRWAERHFEVQEVDPMRDDLDHVSATLQAMPEDLRLPLVLHYHEGMKYREIAIALDCPEGTVAKRLHLARARLKERLAKDGVAIPSFAGGAVFSAMFPTCSPFLERRVLDAVSAELGAGATTLSGSLASKPLTASAFVVALLSLTLLFVWDHSSGLASGTPSRDFVARNDADGATSPIVNPQPSVPPSRLPTSTDDLDRAANDEHDAPTAQAPPEADTDDDRLRTPPAPRLAINAMDSTDAAIPTISGHVRDSDGHPIADATVIAIASWDSEHSGIEMDRTRTDARGFYEFVALDESNAIHETRNPSSHPTNTEEDRDETSTAIDWAKYKPPFMGQTSSTSFGLRVELCARHGGYRSEQEQVPMPRNVERVRHDLKLDRARPITGRVSGGGTGITGATIRVVGLIGSKDARLDALRPEDRVATSQADGQFSLDRVPDCGASRVAVSAPGWVTREFSVVAARTTVEFELRLAARVDLHVYHRDKQRPIAGARVHLYRDGLRADECESDATGHVLLPSIDPGSYELAIYRNALPIHTVSIELKAGEVWRRRIGLDDGYSVRCAVDPTVRPQGESLRAHLHRVQRLGESEIAVSERLAAFGQSWQERQAMTYVSRDGDVTFDGLAPGRYELVVYVTQGKGQIASQRLATRFDIGGPRRQVDIELDDIEVVFGSIGFDVRHRGAALDGAWITLMSESVENGVYRQRVNRSSLVVDVPAGSYKLIATADGFAPKVVENVIVRRDRLTEVPVALESSSQQTAALRRLLGQRGGRQLWLDSGASLSGLLALLESEVAIKRLAPLDESPTLDRVEMSWPQMRSVTEWIEEYLRYQNIGWRVAGPKVTLERL